MKGWLMLPDRIRTEEAGQDVMEDGLMLPDRIRTAEAGWNERWADAAR